MVNETPDFLNPRECQVLKELIEANHVKSAVAGNIENNKIRNSSTSMLNGNLPLIRDIHLRISEKLNIPLSHGEHLQGQRYEVGQYFKEHNDYFGNKFRHLQYCLHSGNRTHTLMIYLNDDIEGGETAFRLLDKKFKPQTGMALDWANMKDGKFVPETLHEGKSITSGKKYIIASWWREKPYNPRRDKMLFKQWKDNGGSS